MKATRRPGRRIVIHDEKQLNPDDGTGWLLFNKVHEVHAGGHGESLTGLVDAILDFLKPQPLALARKRFVSGLSLAGYSLAAGDTYREPHLRLEEQLWFRVDESFPVLRKSQLAPRTRERISHLQYTFDLANLPTHARPELP